MITPFSHPLNADCDTPSGSTTSSCVSCLPRRSALSHLASKLFKGSPHLLLAHMVSDGKLTDAEVRKIRRLLDERRMRKP